VAAGNILDLRAIALFGVIIVTQILATSFLPKTDGFRSLAWTVPCLLFYFGSFWAMSVVISRGLQLGILIPILSAVIPLFLIGVGVFVYGESASLQKIGLLGLACLLVGAASVCK